MLPNLPLAHAKTSVYGQYIIIGTCYFLKKYGQVGGYGAVFDAAKTTRNRHSSFVAMNFIVKKTATLQKG